MAPWSFNDGFFKYDPDDTETAEDEALTIIAANNKRMKRQFTGDIRASGSVWSPMGKPIAVKFD